MVYMTPQLFFFKQIMVMKLSKYQNSDKFFESIENSDFDRILSKILIFDRILPKNSDFW